ncbi:expressed unknown protein [Seminavis robusta]|uniref:DUF1995 domain-containing protein n=1 Tax=Seminavis robusta TaxID=568900 RepID=A0A9N8DXL0_9STRA|nr:expressed unknown protein [Seminavis robusta]|eukprot:Sro453_g146120.1 n/a (293) ;mRNA; f:29902-31056
MKTSVAIALLFPCSVVSLVPLLDGGKQMPKLYDGWLNDQIAKQASTGISNALSAGYDKIEVNFPAVPNVDEVKFGTPLNKKFGTSVVARDLGVVGGYTPGSEVSRELVAFANIYWAKKIAPAVKGGVLGGKNVACLTTENVSFKAIKKTGDVTRTGAVLSPQARQGGRSNEAVICVNPGGEERWDSIANAHCEPGQPFVVLNNAYSTSYDLGNKRGYEEAYYLKRISKGWVFRIFPGPWQAYIERPDGSVELLETYKEKPPLNQVATLVRDTSFKRYAINNDRYAKGFGARL